MLLAVSVIIAVLAQVGIAARLGDAVVEQVCQVLNDERDCPAAQRRRAQERKQAKDRAAARERARDSDWDHVPDAVEKQRGLSAFMRDTDRDGIDDAAEIRARTAGLRITSWDVCRRMLNKAICDTLKGIDRASLETGRFAVGVLCVDSGLCWDAAVALGVVNGDARESVAAMLGQSVGSLLTPAAVVDFVKQVLAGKPIAAAIAAAGVIPIVRAPKVADRIGRFIARNPRAATEVVEKLGLWLGKDSAVLRKVLSLAVPGYGKLRDGRLSHDGVLQLMRAGNDIRYLATRSRMLNRDLSAAERKQINEAIKKHWNNASGKRRTGPYGHEAALVMLARNKEIEILYTGRPGRGDSSGPDIIARNKRTGRTIIVEAKATFSDNKPLTHSKLMAPLNSGSYLQPARPWLKEAGNRGWIDKLAKSTDKKERDAAAAMRAIVDNNAIYDVSIMHTRLPGARAYGDGVDKAVQGYRGDRNIGDVAIVDLDAGRRAP
jgi:hypothetical protein